MAEVFIAESAGIEGFKKRVAIKRVLPHLSEKKKFISMFLDEARLGAHLSHSNCVQTFDIGVGDNAYFIVMEFVDGADLKAVIDYLKNNGQSFPVEIAVLLIVRICEGLTYAHELQGTDGTPLKMVHRDMSPPNILITKHGEVKIVDFGLAKASSQLEKSEPGIIKGKFSYLSPEAALGEDVDLRTDIFAVGIILWELLAGKRLFLGENDFATVKQVQQSVVPSLAQMRRDVPEDLERIIRRSLAKDLKARYGSARDLGRDLTNFLYKYGKPVSSFDIAEIVRGAMALRTKSLHDKSSIIDKLIEEALFEFTSLPEGKDADKKNAAAKADDKLKLGFEDIGSWADDLGSSANRPSIAETNLRATISGVEIGNLAALEESTDGDGSSIERIEVTTKPLSKELTPLPAPSKATSLEQSPFSSKFAEPAVKKSGGSAIRAAVVLVIVAALVAGAWFANLIPH